MKLQGLRFDEQSLTLLVFHLGQQIFQHIIYFLVKFHAEYLLVNDLIIIFSKIHLTRTRLALCLPALKILF